MSVKRLARLRIVSTLCYGQPMLKTKSTGNASLLYPNSAFLRGYLAEGAGFEPAAHGVGAGFQDRWFQPLTHPSDNVKLVGTNQRDDLQ